MKISARRYRSLLTTYFFTQWPQVLVLCVLLFSSISLSLLNPQILRSFIDAVGSGTAMPTLLKIAALFLGVAIAGQLISIVETYFSENISLKATNTLRADLTLHSLELDPAFHVAHTPGEMIERVDGDVATLANFFSRFMVAMLGNGLLLVGILVMLFRIDWRVGTALTVFAIGSMFVVNRLRNIGVPYWEKERQASADLFGFLEERLSGTEDVRSSGSTMYMLRGLAEHSRMVLKRKVAAQWVSSLTWGSVRFFSSLGTVIALICSAWLFTSHQITIGTAYLIFGYTVLLNTPIEQIVQQLRDMQQAGGSVKRILDLLDMDRTIKDGRGEPLAQGALSVELADVSFSYVEDVPVLEHIELALLPGMVMGLLGRTGSGKSTLVKLLVRLHDPVSGVARLGGVDLRDLKLDELRERIGMVSQEVHVLHATVRDNLTLFDNTIPDERIIQALEELGLGAWYRELPEGLDTRMAPGGSGLSAGEAQLLSFARVFLKDPGLVILDEASSRLDPATERLLERAIDRLLEGRTAIIIAHRLATVQRADTIMILEDGHCREYGARDVLAHDADSRYAQLLRAGLEEVLV